MVLLVNTAATLLQDTQILNVKEQLQSHSDVFVIYKYFILKNQKQINHICIGACYKSNIFKDLSVVEQTSTFNLNAVFY